MRIADAPQTQLAELPPWNWLKTMVSHAQTA
jgi:hypothetical protein